MNNTYILHSSEIGHKQGFSRLSRPLVTNVGYTLPHSTVRHSGTQRNTVEHRETRREHRETRREHSGIQRNTTRTQWNTEKHSGVQRNTTEYNGQSLRRRLPNLYPTQMVTQYDHNPHQKGGLSWGDDDGKKIFLH
jgi:hypothetical protein